MSDPELMFVFAPEVNVIEPVVASIATFLFAVRDASFPVCIEISDPAVIVMVDSFAVIDIDC